MREGREVESGAGESRRVEVSRFRMLSLSYGLWWIRRIRSMTRSRGERVLRLSSEIGSGVVRSTVVAAVVVDGSEGVGKGLRRRIGERSKDLGSGDDVGGELREFGFELWDIALRSDGE